MGVLFYTENVKSVMQMAQTMLVLPNGQMGAE